MMRRLLPLSAALAFAASLSPRLAAEPGVSKDEVVIGSCADLESPSGIRGRMLVQGAKAYLDHVNASGGIHGRKVRILSYDDSYDPDKTIECFNRLTKEGIFAASFSNGTPTAAKLVPMAQARKIPFVGIVSGAQFVYEPVKRYVFTFRASYDDELQGLIDGLRRELGFERIGVIYQEDAFGAAGLQGAIKALQRHRAEPVATGSFPRGTLDVDKAIAVVKAAKPDAVVLSMIGPPAREIARKAAAMGWHPLFVTITIDPAVYEADGVVIAQVLPPWSDSRRPAAALYEKLLKGYPGAHPSYVGFEGFIQAELVAEGLRRAGPALTREAYVDALESIRGFDVGLGPDLRVSFSPTSHGGTTKVFFTVVRGGKVVEFSDWKTVLPPGR